MEPTPIFTANLRAYSDAWKTKGVSLGQQAARCNMGKPAYSQLRSGNVQAPSIWTAVRLAEGLGVTVDDLVTDRPSVREATCRRIFEGKHRGAPA
jgi:transcriptional regulator with XRE-family HTH domain